MLRRVALVLVVGALVALGARLLGRSASNAGSASVLVMPVVGQPAPRFDLPDQGGRTVAVGGPSASWTILSFYRAAGTPW